MRDGRATIRGSDHVVTTSKTEGAVSNSEGSACVNGTACGSASSSDSNDPSHSDGSVASICAEPHIPAEMRTLCVLRALERYSDDRHYISAPNIASLLAEGKPDLPVTLHVAASSVRNSISTLRKLGYDIRTAKNHGYALATRALTEHDLRQIVRAVLGGTLGNAHRLQLVRALVPLAGPTQRLELEALLKQGGGSDLVRRCGTIYVAAVKTPELLRRCLAAGATATFELPSGLKRMRPLSVFPSGGTLFVEGEIVDARGEHPLLRTLRTDRFRALSCRLPTGTVLVAVDTLAPPRLQVGDERPASAGV